MAEHSNPLLGHRIAAGALLWSPSHELLLVKPWYRPYWQMSGGMVEACESPKQALEREILEELGLSVPLRENALLAVGYVIERGHCQFVFDGGVLTWEQLYSITLQESELTTCVLIPPEGAELLLPVSMIPVVHAALQAKEDGRPRYMDMHLP